MSRKKRTYRGKNPKLHRFLGRPTSVIGGIVLLLFFMTALVGPLIVRTNPNENNLSNTWALPSAEHPLGTDNLGRDTLARIIYGARTTLLVSFSAVAIGSIIGILLGVLAGYFGSMVDTIIARFIDIFQAFPGILLAILVIAILGTS